MPAFTGTRNLNLNTRLPLTSLTRKQCSGLVRAPMPPQTLTKLLNITTKRFNTTLNLPKQEKTFQWLKTTGTKALFITCLTATVSPLPAITLYPDRGKKHISLTREPLILRVLTARNAPQRKALKNTLRNTYPETGFTLQ
ncbi:MAG: hypothetical protein BWY84_00655 [Candidatus Aerophobetes bacterium ADurb.Bin490]|nr:MAG: hypothetical protein BWY84_00655 [Candidatus Aerophobetes bacterium ADurb.Bin490]